MTTPASAPPAPGLRPVVPPIYQSTTFALTDEAYADTVGAGGLAAGIRQWMEVPGRFRPGRRNAITDVAGMAVGHRTLRSGASTRTGVTVVLPHPGDPFADRCPAAVHVGNGFGKLRAMP